VVFDEEARFAFDQSHDLLQRTQHQVCDVPASPAANMVMMLTALAEFVSELAFLKFNPRYHSQLFEHRQGPVDGHKIHGYLLTSERGVNFCDAHRVSRSLKHGEYRLSGARQPASVTLKTLEKRMSHCAQLLLQTTCIYHM
jgi:hypothetical protein